MRFQELDKRVKQKIKILKIYRKENRKPFCEIEVPNKEFFDNFHATLNGTEKYIKIGQVIFKKEDFDYAVYEEI